MASRTEQDGDKSPANSDPRIRDQFRKRPSRNWSLDELFAFAKRAIDAARRLAVPLGCLDAMPAWLVHRAGKALVIARARLAPVALGSTLTERYGIPDKLAWPAIWLAKRASAKSCQALKLGEALIRFGIRKATSILEDQDQNLDLEDSNTDHQSPESGELDDDVEIFEIDVVAQGKLRAADRLCSIVDELEQLDAELAEVGIESEKYEHFILSLDRADASLCRMQRTIAEPRWFGAGLGY